MENASCRDATVGVKSVRLRPSTSHGCIRVKLIQVGSQPCGENPREWQLTIAMPPYVSQTSDQAPTRKSDEPPANCPHGGRVARSNRGRPESSFPQPQTYRVRGCVIEPARCRACGFEFSESKLNKPSKCPKCHSTWVLEPKIGIKQST